MEITWFCKVYKQQANYLFDYLYFFPQKGKYSQFSRKLTAADRFKCHLSLAVTWRDKMIHTTQQEVW